MNKISSLKKSLLVLSSVFLSALFIFSPKTSLAVDNPTLNNSSSLQIVLILDSSGSMSAGDIAAEKEAATSLTNALMPSTPTQIGVIDFNTHIVSSINPTSVKADVLAEINSVSYHSSASTNWDAALNLASTMIGSGGLVIILTDGNPTTHDGSGTNLGNAIVRADAIKTAGSRILAFGVDSSGSGGGLNTDNLIAISGSQVKNLPGDTFSNINDVDVALGDISYLNTALIDLATILYGGTLNVQIVIDGDPEFSQFVSSGFDFTIAGQSVVTNEIGGAGVHVDTVGPWSMIQNIDNDYYNFVSASCTENGEPITVTPITNGVSGIILANQETDAVTCVFHNSPNFGILNVITDVNGGTATASDFTMYVKDGETNDIFPSPFAGNELGEVVMVDDSVTYSVSGTGPSGYSQTFSADCNDSMYEGEVKNCTATYDYSILNPTTYIVTPSIVGENGSVSPSSPQTIESGAITSFTIVPDDGYTINSIGGSCPYGNIVGDIYTTGNIVGDCSVEITFTHITYTVTPSIVGVNGTISPSSSQTVNSGETTSFTITPDDGYTASVGGTCATGILNGTDYVTGAITNNCSVEVTFTQISTTTYTVTPNANSNGTISPSSSQTVNSGETTSFTITPDDGYTASVGGTCATGILNGTDYVTGAITNNCSVEVTFREIRNHSSRHLSHAQTTGSSLEVLLKFKAEQLARALAVGIDPTPYLNYDSSFNSISPENLYNTTFTFTRTLKYGMEGEDVKLLQIYLNTHGYVLDTIGAGSPGNETNYFGSKTRQAVIKFQLANYFTPDGIVGPLTGDLIK